MARPSLPAAQEGVARAPGGRGELGELREARAEALALALEEIPERSGQERGPHAHREPGEGAQREPEPEPHVQAHHGEHRERARERLIAEEAREPRREREQAHAKHEEGCHELRVEDQEGQDAREALKLPQPDAEVRGQRLEVQRVVHRRELAPPARVGLVRDAEPIDAAELHHEAERGARGHPRTRGARQALGAQIARVQTRERQEQTPPQGHAEEVVSARQDHVVSVVERDGEEPDGEQGEARAVAEQDEQRKERQEREQGKLQPGFAAPHVQAEASGVPRHELRLVQRPGQDPGVGVVSGQRL